MVQIFYLGFNFPFLARWIFWADDVNHIKSRNPTKKWKIHESVIFHTSFEWAWPNFAHLLRPLLDDFSIINFFEFVFSIWMRGWPQTALWAMNFLSKLSLLANQKYTSITTSLPLKAYSHDLICSDNL